MRSGTKCGIGVLQHFQENPCCKHIVLGSCHDNGYVCHLDVIRSEGSMHDRITLLKSFQTGRQYGELPFKSIRLPSLFRSQPFLRSALESDSSNGKSSIASVQSYAARASALDEHTTGPAFWAPGNTAKSNPILVNAKGDRLDRFLPKPSKATVTIFHRKKRELEAKGKRGACYDHYLGGGCPMPTSKCQFWHDGLDKADISVLKWFMRSQSCDKGLRCRSALCYYSHACFACKPPCKFGPEMHQVDRTGEHEVPGE